MRAVGRQRGFVEITLREDVYRHLKGVLTRFLLCEEKSEDYGWLDRFVADLEKRDAEDLGLIDAASQ